MTASVRFTYEGRQYCFEHPEGDHIGRVQQRAQSFYELDLLEHVRRSLSNRAGIVVDIGAHVGNHAVYFANYLGPVIAFEPTRDIFGLLVKNISSNTETAVSLINGALWDAPALFVESVAVREQNTGMNQVAKTKTPGSGAVFTFDHHALHGLSIKLIKIDVEGAEKHVLAGLRPILASSAPALAIEAATPEALRAQQELLEPHGYKRVGPFCKTPTYVWTR